MAAKPASRLLDLANKIQAQVAEIQQHLVASGQPEPSFDGQSQEIDLNEVHATKSAVLDNLTELQDLLWTPQEMLLSRLETEPISRQALDRFGILDAVPINGSATYDELAERSKVPVKPLRRIIRHAIAFRMFYEPEPGRIAHTHASRLLAENSHNRDLFRTTSDEIWPAATRVCDAVTKWGETADRAECGYFLATGMTFYDALRADPVKQARHDNSYGAFKNDRAFSLQNVFDNYDWAALGDAKIVDVGGGVGTVSKALAGEFPKLRFLVQDQPSVLDARNVADDIPRVEYMSHDFFTPQPVHDGDVYMFRRVLMDWTDEQVVQILANLKPALRPGARVIAVDSQIPEPGTCPLWLERRFRSVDMLGLSIGAKGSREIGEWKGLFEKAGPGFEVKSVLAVPETEIAIIEAVWKGA